MPNPAIWGDDPVREVIIVAVVFLLVGLFNAWRLGWFSRKAGKRRAAVLGGGILVLLLMGVWLFLGK